MATPSSEAAKPTESTPLKPEGPSRSLSAEIVDKVVGALLSGGPTDAATKVASQRGQGTLLQRWLTGSQERFWGTMILLACCVSLTYIDVTTFIPAPVGLLNVTAGEPPSICPRETVCAVGVWQLALLLVSRSTAYATYPLTMLLFLSKANHLRTLLQQSYLSLYIPFYDLHELHVFAVRRRRAEPCGRWRRL